MINILITSEKKGSNPGGRCKVPFRGQTLDFYLKYCNGSQLPKYHPFKPYNQPVYEAITLAIAKYFGLEVPRYFLLINNNHSSVSFTYADTSLKKKPLDPTKKSYLLSELAQLPKCVDTGLMLKEMAQEKVYRDLLMIGDVSNKNQNYTLLDPDNYQFTHSSTTPYIYYIDLGCSFVDAHEGFIGQRHAVSRLISIDEFGLTSSARKEINHASDYLDKYYLRTTHKDSNKVHTLKLSAIPKMIGDLPLPLFQNGIATPNVLLSPLELKLIEGLLTLNMAEVVHDYVKNHKTDAISLVSPHS
jgi:hypothetical protein